MDKKPRRKEDQMSNDIPKMSLDEAMCVPVPNEENWVKALSEIPNKPFSEAMKSLAYKAVLRSFLFGPALTRKRRFSWERSQR